MLDYRIQQVTLCFSRSGELLPWIGPALRGLLAIRLKEQVCRQPADERNTRWKHCTGCPHLEDCPYGQLFEPDSPQAVVRTDQSARAIRFSGAEQAARPLVVAPWFPASDTVRPGFYLPVKITAVGQKAVTSLEHLLVALRDAGRVASSTAPDASGRRTPPRIVGGLGPHHVGFTLADAARSPGESGRLSPADFPPAPDAIPGVIPRLGVGLTAPLFIRPRDQAGRRRALDCPQFADLFLAAARTISALFALHDAPLPADFLCLKAAAQSIRCAEHCYQSFRQRKWSSRNAQRFMLHGVVGGGVYENVPLAFLPWMLWGGRLHVGQHRVAGAGGWRLVLD